MKWIKSLFVVALLLLSLSTQAATLNVASMNVTIIQGSNAYPVRAEVTNTINTLITNANVITNNHTGTVTLLSNLYPKALLLTNGTRVTTFSNNTTGFIINMVNGPTNLTIGLNDNGNIPITLVGGGSVLLNANTSIGTTTSTNTVNGTTMFPGVGTTTIGGLLAVSNGVTDIPVYVAYTGVTNGILDLSLGSTFMVTNLTNHLYVTLTNAASLGGRHKNITLMTQESGAGGWFVTWNTNLSISNSKFSYGVVPVNNTNPNACTVYSGTTAMSGTNVFWVMTDNFLP